MGLFDRFRIWTSTFADGMARFAGSFLARIDRSRSGLTPHGRKPGAGERVISRMLRGSGTYGWPGGWTQDRLEQCLHFKHWVFIAVSAICEEIAGLVPNVALVHSEGVGEQHTRSLPWQHLRKVRYEKSLHAIRPHEEVEPVSADHPLARLLAQPNGVDTAWDLWYELLLFLGLTGNAYLWAPPSIYGRLSGRMQPAELWVIPSHWVWPKVGTSGRWIEHYEIRPLVGSGSFIIPPEEIIPFAYPSPIHKVDGWSPLTAIAEWVDCGESIDRSRFWQFKNGCFPVGAIELSPEFADPDEPEIDRIGAKFYARYQGEQNTGRPVVLPPGAKYNPLTIAPVEMAYQQSGDQMRDWVLAGYRVPKEIAGLQDAGSEIAMYGPLTQFAMRCIRPKLVMLSQALTVGLARRWDERCRIWWDDPTPNSPDQVLKEMSFARDSGAISPNEIRVVQGREPWKLGGDNPMLQGKEMPWETAKVTQVPGGMDVGALGGGQAPGAAPSGPPGEPAAEEGDEGLDALLGGKAMGVRRWDPGQLVPVGNGNGRQKCQEGENAGKPGPCPGPASESGGRPEGGEKPTSESVLPPTGEIRGFLYDMDDRHQNERDELSERHMEEQGKLEGPLSRARKRLERAEQAMARQQEQSDIPEEEWEDTPEVLQLRDKVELIENKIREVDERQTREQDELEKRQTAEWEPVAAAIREKIDPKLAAGVRHMLGHGEDATEQFLVGMLDDYMDSLGIPSESEAGDDAETLLESMAFVGDLVRTEDASGKVKYRLPAKAAAGKSYPSRRRSAAVALSRTKARLRCQQGPNAGKPGPCPGPDQGSSSTEGPGQPAEKPAEAAAGEGDVPTSGKVANRKRAIAALTAVGAKGPKAVLTAAKMAWMTPDRIEHVVVHFAKTRFGKEAPKEGDEPIQGPPAPKSKLMKVGAAVWLAIRCGTKAAFISWTAAEAAAEAVAKERGATPEEATAFRHTLLMEDSKIYKAGALAMHLVPGAQALEVPYAFIPVASLSYLAYSTAKDPAAVLRAARKGAAAAWAKVRGKTKAHEDLEAVFDAIQAHGGDDYYTALLMAAFDLTHDMVEAARVADAAWEEERGGGATEKGMPQGRLKGKGGPCEQGETAASTGCTPASGEGSGTGGGESESKPTGSASGEEKPRTESKRQRRKREWDERYATWEKAHEEWKARDNQRNQQREDMGSLEGDFLSEHIKDLQAQDPQMNASGAKYGTPEDNADYAQRIEEYAEEFGSVWEQTASEWTEAMKTAGLPEADIAKMQALADKGGVAIKRAGERWSKIFGKYADAAIRLAKWEGKEPEEPEAPEGLNEPGLPAQSMRDQHPEAAKVLDDAWQEWKRQVEARPDEYAAYADEVTAWDKVHDAWNEKADALDARKDELDGAQTEAGGNMDKVRDKFQDRIGSVVGDAVEKHEAALKKEDAGDHEPEEPDEPDWTEKEPEHDEAVEAIGNALADELSDLTDEDSEAQQKAFAAIDGLHTVAMNADADEAADALRAYVAGAKQAAAVYSGEGNAEAANVVRRTAAAALRALRALGEDTGTEKPSPKPEGKQHGGKRSARDILRRMQEKCQTGPNAGKPGPCPGSGKPKPAAGGGAAAKPKPAAARKPAKPKPEKPAKPKKPDVAEVHASVERMRTEGATADGLQELAAKLSAMTVVQLNDLKKRLGTKGGKAKPDLIEKLKARAAEIAEQGKAEAKPEPAASAEKPEAKKPDPARSAAQPHRGQLSPAGQRVTAAIQGHLAGQAHLSKEQQAHYGNSFSHVVARMPDAAVARVQKNLGKISFHGSHRELTEELAKKHASVKKLLDQGGMARGAYEGGERKLFLDGDVTRGVGDDALGRDRTNAHETYAHELAHVVDGPDHEYSKHTDWQAAWKEEIGDKLPVKGKRARLSAYATTSASEGFAEFGRMVYGSDADRAAIEKYFPRCATFWKAKGVWL